jgi:hypothetical protein
MRKIIVSEMISGDFETGLAILKAIIKADSHSGGGIYGRFN